MIGINKPKSYYISLALAVFLSSNKPQQQCLTAQNGWIELACCSVFSVVYTSLPFTAAQEERSWLELLAGRRYQEFV